MITAKIIADSIFKEFRIITFELEYPRFIHSEFLTHRQFSRNSASSRAIPIDSMLQNINANPASPIHWGKNQTGMQAREELTGIELYSAKAIWGCAAREACGWSKSLANAGVHKQIANRITEPFQTMKTVVTATEWDNWFKLRDHKDAQPEIQELARLMRVEKERSIPMSIGQGDWHLPYITRVNTRIGCYYEDSRGVRIPLEDAKIISASCCAQVSYRKSDDTLEKAKNIFDRLVNSSPPHASPVEHQATPMWIDQSIEWEPGITHMDRQGQFWSGNFRGWIQFRQLLKETK